MSILPQQLEREVNDSFRRIELLDGVPVRKVVVHEFSVADVEDPDLWAAEPLLTWEKSAAGQWVMEHAVETPVWHRMIDYTSYSHRYAVVARLRDEDYVFYKLKFK